MIGVDKMNNTFTPEEARKPVTYGELLTIFQPVIEDICKRSINYTDTLQEHTFEIINKLTDHLVEIRDDAEYKRQRDVRFMTGLLAQLYHCDIEVVRNEYKHWCEEFDKLNRPQGKLE